MTALRGAGAQVGADARCGAIGLSRSLRSMHPTVMTMLAEERALDMRCAATQQRRGRLARARMRRVFALRRPRVAHA